MNNKVERFLNIKVDLYKERNTYINYKIDLVQLDAYMTKNIGEKWVEEVTNDDMEVYVQHLKNNGYQASSINRKIASASSFFGYCLDKGWIEKNPMKGIELFRVLRKRKNTLEIEDIRSMIASTYKRGAREKNYEFTSARNRFILALLTTTGLRIGELMNLRLDNLDKIDEGYMINIDAENIKNKITKRVPIANKTLEYFNEYMEERKKCGFEDNKILIVSRTGKKMTRDAIQKMINKYAEKNGLLDMEITPHTFRHSCTGILRKNRVEDSLIYNILGWKEGIISVYTDDISMLDSAKVISCNII